MKKLSTPKIAPAALLAGMLAIAPPLAAEESHKIPAPQGIDLVIIRTGFAVIPFFWLAFWAGVSLSATALTEKNDKE